MVTAGHVMITCCCVSQEVDAVLAGSANLEDRLPAGLWCEAGQPIHALTIYIQAKDHLRFLSKAL